MSKKEDSLAESIVQVLDKLAGKESDLELEFRDIQLETMGLKTKVSGSILLKILYEHDEKKGK